MIKKALVLMALAAMAACGGEPPMDAQYGTITASEVQVALKAASNSPPVLDTVFLDFGDGTVHTHPAGQQDLCAGKVLPNVADIGCDNACKDAIVTAVRNDLSNPLYATAANPTGRLPFNVTRIKPDFTDYHTVVVVQSGDFCGMGGWNGSTPGGNGCSGASTRIFATSYVFDLRAPGSAADKRFQIPAAPQDVADTIAHEVGHQYGLVHSGPWSYLNDDIAGPGTAWQNHFFAWGYVPVYAAENPCGYATQDSFGQLYSWVQLGHSMR
jgi:hypothetical protein